RPSCMYGAVSATSRRLGVRHAPDRAGYADKSKALPASPLKADARENAVMVDISAASSFLRPVEAPSGRHLAAVFSSARLVQSQAGAAAHPAAGCDGLEGTQSASVGTDSPTWGTPTSWN